MHSFSRQKLVTHVRTNDFGAARLPPIGRRKTMWRRLPGVFFFLFPFFLPHPGCTSTICVCTVDRSHGPRAEDTSRIARMKISVFAPDEGMVPVSHISNTHARSVHAIGQRLHAEHVYANIAQPHIISFSSVVD